MVQRNLIVIICSLIVALAGVVATAGLRSHGSEELVTYTSARGETVTLFGGGLYKYDSYSFATQGIAQDAVTLFAAIPALIVALVMATRNFFTGRLLLSGVLGYFLYTYLSYLFGVTYNWAFLLYAALVALSLFAFIVVLGEFEPATVSSRFSTRLPRRTIAAFLLFLATMVSLMWLGRIGPSLLDNVSPEGLEHYTTLVIQALDFGILLPAMFLSGVLLWRGHPWGFLLAPVMLVKGSTLLLAIVAMIINEIRAGIAVQPVESTIFVLFAIVSFGFTAVFLSNVQDG